MGGVPRPSVAAAVVAVLCLLVAVAACSTTRYDDLEPGECVSADDREIIAGNLTVIDCADYRSDDPEHWRVVAVGDVEAVQLECPTLFHGVVVGDEEGYAVCFGK